MTDDYIDQLLAKARLAPTAPYTQADIDAAEKRLERRLAAPRCCRTESPPPTPSREATNPAARDLTTMCEVLLTRPGAVASLGNFHQSHVLEPRGARVLGGILYLAACEDSARFWWQYAAGASDPVSSYCLYLYHRSMGEDGEADWWLHHTRFTPATLSEEATKREIATALNVLNSLRKKTSRRLPEALRALVEYVSAVVGFVDEDLELPLPDGNLAELVEEITLHGPSPENQESKPKQRPLPERKHCAADQPQRALRNGYFQPPRWIQDIEIALRQCERTVTC